ncbi:hypothetical protein [Rhizobium sp. Leaf311]|uniref:hypothetical protein n=1 Tax=Rhizobium sp. Leaf311 TaxID=1736332 RepID=UPI000B0B8971|nr:hypothetical protein [Rhizobium sp. Leaf311]
MVKSLDGSEFEAFEPGYFDNFLDDRDHLHTLLRNVDWEAQLLAVRQMISRNRKAGEAFSASIKDDAAELDAYNGPHRHHWENRHVDMKFESSYSDAAESMAAIGMIAPMVESTIGQALTALGDMYDSKSIHPGSHKRWKRAEGHKHRWNCQFYFDSKMEAHNDIFRGLPQLSSACGLDKFLSQDFKTWFEAMFRYRNYMFHGGFEWSLERRDNFEKEIEKNGWGKFFTSSTTNSRPWIYYIRDEAIVAMPRMVEHMLDSLGLFTKSLPWELTSLP